jgi:heat shock protein HspQ
MSAHTARFSIGQVVYHSRFGYRGVIVDVDATFQHSEEWYDAMARSRPPRDQPWYHVLVHDSDHMTYVAERHLEACESADPIRHPDLSDYFDEFRDGRYARSGSLS